MRDLLGGCGTCMLSLVSISCGVLPFMLTLHEFDKGAPLTRRV